MNEKLWLEAASLASTNLPVHYQGTQIIKSEGWEQLINPGLKDPATNEVRRSLIRPEEIDSKIEEVFLLYRSYSLPFQWAIGPMASPGIEERIAPRASISWEYAGMAKETYLSNESKTSIQIERVTQDNLDEYLRVNLTGWELGEFSEAAKDKLQRMATHPAYRCFLAKKDGVYVGTGASILKEGYGYLIGAVVLNDYRGSGAYRALIDARMNDLAKEGFPFAVTQARCATSAPILAKIGFGTVFRGRIYQFSTAPLT